MAHDPSASQATFVEMSFGINILWAAFDRFNELFSQAFSRNTAEKIASVQAMESKNENSGNRLAILKEKITNIAAKQQKYQDHLLRASKVLALTAAVACVIVVYLDMIDSFEKKIIFLVLPLPLHMFLALLIYAGVRLRIWRIMTGYQDFVKVYETNPKAIEDTLKTLDTKTPPPQPKPGDKGS